MDEAILFILARAGSGLLGCGFVDALEGVIDQSAKGQQHFLARLAAVFPEFRREDTLDALVHFVMRSAGMFAHICRDVFFEFLFVGRFFSHRLSLLA